MDEHAETPMSADEARAALNVAASARVAGRAEIRTLRSVLVGVGVAWSLVLPLAKVTGGQGWPFWAGMLTYFVVLAGLLVWQRRTVRAVPRGYAKWYAGGIAGAALMYSVGILVVDIATPWPLVWLFVALVLAPPLVGAARIGTRVGGR